MADPKSGSALHDVVAQSMKWSAVAEACGRLIGPVLTLVTARFLDPKVFGLVAGATVVVAFLQVILEAGMGKAVVQTSSDTDEAAHDAFWTVAVMGIVGYALLFSLAPIGSAALLANEQATPIVRVLGLNLISASVAVVPQALLTRKMAFRALAVPKLLATALPGIVSLPLALLSWGAWALVIGSVVGNLAATIVMWNASGWKCRRRPSLAGIRVLLKYGGWVVGEGVLWWFFSWADHFIVGMSFGAPALGIYATASRVVNAVVGIMQAPVIAVLFPLFSTVRANPVELRAVFSRAISGASFVAFPLGILFLMASGGVSEALLGSRWTGIGVVVAVIGAAKAVSAFVSPSAELYRAIGRPDINVKVLLSTVPVYLGSYLLVGALEPFHSFVFLRAGLALASIPIHVLVCSRVGSFSIRDTWAAMRSPVLSGGAMMLVAVGIDSGLQGRGFHAWSVAIAITLVSSTVYAVSLRIVDPHGVELLLRFGRKAIMG